MMLMNSQAAKNQAITQAISGQIHRMRHGLVYQMCHGRCHKMCHGQSH